jgi:hypothetical protein
MITAAAQNAPVFEAALEHGRAMSVDEIVHYAVAASA